MKKICALLVSVILLVTSFALAGCGNDKTKEFYDLVSDSQEYLDELADTIYSNWYDAIYDDAYGGDIDLAIYFAQSELEYEISVLESNDSKIAELYKKAREGKFEYEVKSVMTAYTNYYEFVVNVSGSFKTFSAEKETYKKQLASALHALEMEL